MEVTHNDDADRFEYIDEGRMAFLRYEAANDRLVLEHTEVPKSLEGRGLGGKLVRAALAHAREHDLTVVAVCPFVSSYLDRHPDEAASVRTSPPA
jgi:uncharacterized protein